MITTSNEYKQYIAGERVFHVSGTITLSDSTILDISDNDIMSSGVKIDDSSSDDGVFTIGSAIINQLTLILNNDNGQFDTYDFTGAILRPQIGLQLSTTTEWLNKGVFTVDEAKAVGSTIVLTALDNMNKFDTSFSYVSITFPCSARSLLQTTCTHCGVELASTTFLNSDYIITTRPSDEAITCREVISWIAQLSGSFARCNTNGALELKWYDFGVFSNDLDGGTFDSDNPYSSGDSADGGDFTFSETTNYDGGTFEDMERYHHIYSMQSATISTDDIVITGIQAIVTDTGESFLYGTDEYVLIIENPLIKQGDAELIATTVGQKIVGMRFRPLSVSALSDPSIEAGDVAWVSDRKGNSYPTVITNSSYTIGSFENISCEAETVSKKQSVRYTPQEKAVAEIKEIVEKESTAREEAIAELNETISQSGGLFYTVEALTDGSKINYLHDKPTLVASNIVWKMTAEAMAVSTDGGVTYTAGITADGNAIVNRLNTNTITSVTINSGKVVSSSFLGGEIESSNYRKRDENGELIVDETTEKPILTGEGTFIDLLTGVAVFSGEYSYKWLEENEATTHSAYIKLENGRLRITDTTNGQNTLFYSHEGISTTDSANNASGVIDFRSRLYNAASEGSEYKGITIRTKNSPVALMSTENSVIINPRSDSSTSLFDFDTSTVSNFGRLRFGNRTFVTDDEDGTISKQLDCGLLFDNTDSAQAIYATDGEGTKDGLIDFHAKNIYAESINGGNASKPLTALSITSSTIVETNADGTNTYTITRDANGVITSVDDGDGNTITISIS